MAKLPPEAANYAPTTATAGCASGERKPPRNRRDDNDRDDD